MLFGTVVNFHDKKSPWLVENTFQSGELTSDIFKHGFWC
jgi:hypothetical protein